MYDGWIGYRVLGSAGAIQCHADYVGVYLNSVLIPAKHDGILRRNKVSGRRGRKAGDLTRVAWIADSVDGACPVDWKARGGLFQGMPGRNRLPGAFDFLLPRETWPGSPA